LKNHAKYASYRIGKRKFDTVLQKKSIFPSFSIRYGFLTNGRLSMDWEALVQIEPRLATLLREVETADTGEKRSFCGVTAWHGSGGRPGFKMRAFRLVGFGCSNPELRTRDAYETVLEKLYAAFPPCRGCACLAEEELEACA